jgi:FixJ family two-component response regulator
MSLGYLARTFASAEEFLHSRSINETNCLVADVQLSGMSGIEMQGLLAAQGYRKPIIFITAFPDDRTKTRALRHGAIGFLTKPFDGNALIECLEAAVGKK